MKKFIDSFYELILDIKLSNSIKFSACKLSLSAELGLGFPSEAPDSGNADDDLEIAAI